MTVGDPTCPIHGQALCHCTAAEKLGALMAPQCRASVGELVSPAERVMSRVIERLTRERDEARADLASLRTRVDILEALCREGAFRSECEPDVGWANWRVRVWDQTGGRDG